MKYNNKTMSVAEFTELKKQGKIKLDPSFQVGTDKESRWDKRQQSKFIKSILFGSAPSPFILVDIDAALDYNEGIGIDDDNLHSARGMYRRYGRRGREFTRGSHSRLQ